MVIYGIYYALGLSAGALAAGYLISWPWALPFMVLAVFCLWFFRDPDREIPIGPVGVAEYGKVVAVKAGSAGPGRA